MFGLVILLVILGAPLSIAGLLYWMVRHQPVSKALDVEPETARVPDPCRVCRNLSDEHAEWCIDGPQRGRHHGDDVTVTPVEPLADSGEWFVNDACKRCFHRFDLAAESKGHAEWCAWNPVRADETTHVEVVEVVDDDEEQARTQPLNRAEVRQLAFPVPDAAPIVDAIQSETGTWNVTAVGSGKPTIPVESATLFDQVAGEFDGEPLERADLRFDTGYFRTLFAPRELESAESAR